MEEKIKQKISENFNFAQKILLKLFPKSYIKAYHVGRIETINFLLNSKKNY